VGLAIERLRAVGLDAMGGELGGEAGGVLVVERLERDLGDEPGAEQEAQRLELLAARRGGAKQRRRRVQPQEELQPLQGFGIAPVQIVDGEQQGRARREHGTRHGLEEVALLPGLGKRRGRRDIGLFGEDFGQDAGELRALHGG